jgi:hypothetical protein
MEIEMRHLHRIVGARYGANILGLLEILAFFAVFTAGCTYVGPYSRALMGVLFLSNFAGIIGFDLWWRHRQPEASRWTRLFSPFTGGCFIFAPIWLLLVLLVVFVAGVGLTMSLR